MTPRLSAVIIALNESARIEACLKAARTVADEIVVVDGGSADDTVRRASALADKVVTHPFANYASQKNFAVSQAGGNWILSIDADEIVTDALAGEIARTLDRNDRFAAYRIRRKSRIFGRYFRFTGTQDDRPVRLFQKKSGRFESPIHETLKVDGAIGRLRSELLHHTYADIRDYWTRLNRYTSAEADFFVASGRPPISASGMWLRPAGMFARLYFARQGFRDGLEGFAFSVLSGYYVFAKHAKHRELLSRQAHGR